MKPAVNFKLVAVTLAVFALLGGAQFLLKTSPSVSAEGVTARRGVPIEMVISVDDFHKMTQTDQRFLLLDARNKTFYAESHIAGAVLPLTEEYYKQEALFKK